MLKVEKSQKIGNGTFGNCYIALYRNEYRVVAKEMKIIESPKKTREEVWREASAITGIGEHWGIPLLFGVSTDRAPFYLVLQFHPEWGWKATLGISGWGCAAGALEPLTYTRAT